MTPIGDQVTVTVTGINVDVAMLPPAFNLY